MHLNKKHVFFHVERSQEVLKTIFVVKTKENSRAELKQTFWNVLDVVLENWCFFILVKSPNNFRKVCTKMIKTIAHNTKQRRPRFRKTSKAVFKSIRYSQTSQTQDVKSQSTKRSLRKIAQPKRDSALEQKTRIVSCREISASCQNNFFIYNQRIKPSRAQKDISVTYSTSLWKVSVLLKKQKLFL